jgi:phage terminase small subunit
MKMKNDLLYMARSLGFDGESREELDKLCDENNVSDDMREKMVKEYEEGYFDW